VILISECRAHGEGENHFLRLTQPFRAGFEFTTSRMLSESTTARLPQPVCSCQDTLKTFACLF
jgi:hypothetical protein